MTRWWLAVLLIAGCDSNAAPPQGAPPRTSPSTPSSPAPGPAVSTAPADAHPATLPGKEMYGALCAPCHGKDLKGYAADNAPSLVTPSFLESASDDFLRRSIATGRPGTSMAAYGTKLGGPLDDAAVERLVEYIRAQGPKAKDNLPAVGKGDPKSGADLYGKLCVACHGDKQNRREGIHLANMMFQAQATDAFIKYGIVHGRPGTKMIPFGEQLSDQQIDDLVAHIRILGGQAPKIGMLPAPTGKEPIVINPKGKDPKLTPRDDRFVSVDQVYAAYKAGAKMAILDARPPSDWMRAHIKGAVSFPYHEISRLKDIPKDVAVFAYCACPHHLSGIVVDELRKLGHKKAYVLDEGVNDWHRKGYPMTVAEGVEPPANEHHGHSHGHEGHGH